MIKHGGRRAGAGRKPKPIAERSTRNGKLAFWISLEHAAKLQALMLRDTPGVKTPEDMIEHLIDSAA